MTEITGKLPKSVQTSGNRARYGFIEIDISTGLDEQIDLGNRPRYVDTELELSRTVNQRLSPFRGDE